MHGGGANDPTVTDGATRYDALVLGAGISGLVSASVLLDQGAERVLVVDEYEHVGGNHLDFAFGPFTFDVGSLIFQDDSPLLRHFPELLTHYAPITPRWGRLNPQGVVTRYPFDLRDDFLAAGPIECFRLVGSALLARVRRRRMRNAREFAEYWIGPRLMYRAGLEKYMERFCGLPAEQIDLQFAQQRMQWIPTEAAAGALLRRVRKAIRTPPPGMPGNQQMARPREGFAALYRPAVQRLERAGVTFLLGAGMTGVRKVEGGFTLQVGENQFTADRLLSTIPVDRALALCGFPIEQPLPTVTLISLFFSFAGDRGFTYPILYNFSHDGAWKRLTVYSDFYGRSEAREYFTVEVIADREHPSVESAERDFRRHTAASGLFAGDLRLEGSYTLEQAYPIYTEGSANRADRAIAALRNFGVESFGRQGGFQYQPTARSSTLEAEAALRAGA